MSGSPAGTGAGQTNAAARFFCDAMLGRLARWLRALGFDTAYEAHIADDALVARARSEGRLVLTRDRRLAEEQRTGGVLVITTDEPVAQLREVLSRLGLSIPERLFTRCTVCNTEVEPLSADEARSRVPPNVLARHTGFTRCRTCGRIYWEGGHVRRMRQRLMGALDPRTFPSDVG
jgi:uncharacterized protein with PIN domain